MIRGTWRLNLIVASYIFSIFVSAAICTASDEHTVAIWLFEEGSGEVAKDASGNGHDGKFIGTPEWAAAKHGKGLDFKGDATSYVEVPHAEELNLEQWTIEGWFMTRSVIGGWDCPFAKETDNPDSRNYALHIQGGGLGIIHGSITVGNAFGHATFGAVNVADSEWHHLAVTYDGNKCTLYLDGQEDFGRSAGGNNGEIGGPTDFNDGPITIGANAVSAFAFDGIIDEVRLSSVPRTADEIKEAMEKGLQALAAVYPNGKLTTTWADAKKRN